MQENFWETVIEGLLGGIKRKMAYWSLSKGVGGEELELMVKARRCARTKCLILQQITW